ncbi:MAG: hypothetical protein Q9169_005983 [Polycauliona sp. 2 TL-2023]
MKFSAYQLPEAHSRKLPLIPPAQCHPSSDLTQGIVFITHIIAGQSQSPQSVPLQPQLDHLDPEGTIQDWLRREGTIEGSSAITKRARTDSSASTDSHLTDQLSEASSPSSTLDQYEEQPSIDPVGADLWASLPSTPIIAHQSSSTANTGASQEPALKYPTDAQWVASRLRTHRLCQNDREAFAKYPKFEEQVWGILNRKRVSSVDPVDFKEFEIAWDEYKDKNEDTVLNKLLPFFIKEKRTVSIEGTADTEDAKAVVSFLKSGLVEISNREFQRTCVPFQQDGSPVDKVLVDALAKIDGITNPKPDRTYGISMKKHLFPSEGFPIPPEIAAWLQIMRDIHHAFFILEGKSFQGNMLDAWNQVNRGGATMNSAIRRILATLGFPNIVGADHRSFVFSATLCPGYMDIWVHWVEVPAPGALPNYHMTKLVSKSLDDEESFGKLRKYLHNILDWGCGSRFTGLQSMYDGIVSYKERQQKKA